MFGSRKRIKQLEDRLHKLERELRWESKATTWFVPEPTIRGKIDAVIAHLGVDLEVVPSREPYVRVKQPKSKKAS